MPLSLPGRSIYEFLGGYDSNWGDLNSNWGANPLNPPANYAYGAASIFFIDT